MSTTTHDAYINAIRSEIEIREGVESNGSYYHAKYTAFGGSTYRTMCKQAGVRPQWFSARSETAAIGKLIEHAESLQG